MSNGGGGKITPQSAFFRISLEPRKMQRCVFMTFPEYGPATKCCI